MGKFIRFFTKEKYNHVSFSFDGNISCAYTFARKYLNTPFYGGLVKDSPDRYFYKNKKADIAVCKIEIGDSAYEKVLSTANAMYEQRDTYIYNFFSAFSSLRKKKLPVKNAFTCVEFAVYLLSLCDIKDTEIDNRKFYSVDSLKSNFPAFYTGEAFFNGMTKKFEKTDFFNGLILTQKNLITLFKRRYSK